MFNPSRVTEKKTTFAPFLNQEHERMFEQTERSNLPTHIAIIMDGNGRWAMGKGAARLFGHHSAIEAVREVTEGCSELEIKYLTLYTFSTENWGRPRPEVEGLMSLLVSTISEEMKTLQENNVRLHTIGYTAGLPKAARDKLATAISDTEANTGLQLILALNYSGKWDIAQATRKLAVQVRDGALKAEDIDTTTLSSALSTASFPDPELMIRTSGEMRISNFLLWQLAYAELYFTDVFWPDFRKKDLEEALVAYQQRERRFGKIKERLS